MSYVGKSLIDGVCCVVGILQFTVSVVCILGETRGIDVDA